MADAKRVWNEAKLLKAVQSFYVDSIGRVSGWEWMSQWFPVNVGLRQGSVRFP